ncbi:hypothetical protein BDW66DRAFT_142760 [Aspergillus desertorum]
MPENASIRANTNPMTSKLTSKLTTKMPFIYNLVDRLSDIVIAVVVSPAKRDRNRDHDLGSIPIQAPKVHGRRREDDNDNSDDDLEPSSYYSCQLSQQYDDEEVAASFAEEGGHPGPGYSNSSSGAEGIRYYRTTRHGKSVHWGGITDGFPDGMPEASAPGLSEFPQRRTSRSPNYVYGADDGAERQSPSSHPRGSRTGSPGRNGSGSGSGNSKLPCFYEEEAGGQEQQSVYWLPRASSSPTSVPGKRQLLHRTHFPRKSILKAPTTLDDVMLIRNLWAMVTISESRLTYTYEFLGGVLLVGDEVLDTMWSAGEMMMYEEANRRARRMQERERKRAARPINTPVSRSQGPCGNFPGIVRSEGGK